MNVLEKLESETYRSLSQIIVRLLDRCSDSTLAQLTLIAEKMTSAPEVLAALSAVRGMLGNPDHGANRLFKRLMNYLPYENKARLFYSLFNNAWFAGYQTKTRTFERYGFWPPFAMILSPTLNCNLRCKGCYILGYGSKHELPYKVVDRVLKECEELGIYVITILGGEPLVYPHLFSMIEDHPNLLFQVYTNGTLINRTHARRFRESNTIVVISIEGYEDETDAWRGKGVYGKVMSAFDTLTEERVVVGSSTTVTAKNIATVAAEDFVDLMVEKGSLLQMYFLYMPVNGSSDFTLLVTPQQRDFLRKQVADFRARKPLFFIDFWNDGPSVGGCIAGGRKYFHVNAKGDIEPCVYTHIATHNIENTSVKEALMSPLFREIRQRQPHSGNHLKPCMIIDNPSAMRGIIDNVRPYFTHDGAEEIYTLRSADLDAYAERFGRYIERVWEEEYQKR